MTRIFIRVAALALFMVAILTGISLYVMEIDVKEEVTNYVFSKQVEEYRPLVEKYAIAFEVEEHVDLLLAMMMQESGGRGDDPMQASESLCGEIGCITNPDDSVKQGVEYFSKALKLAEGDRKLAVQSYNFGIGFVDYVKSDAGEYSEEIAIKFSKMMYEQAEDQSIYSCLRKEAREHDACYGDIYYVRHVMEHEERFSES